MPKSNRAGVAADGRSLGVPPSLDAPKAFLVSARA